MSDRIAVMTQGRLEQLGTPQEIYDRPSSVFVAGFIGSANLLPGRVTDLAKGRVTIHLNAGGQVSGDAADHAFQVGRWRQSQPLEVATVTTSGRGLLELFRDRRVAVTMAILIVLMFSKAAYTQSLATYHTFYLIEKFGVSVQTSQVLLFLFLLSQAAGSLLGGHYGDRFGRLQIIWFSILGALPLTLLLPYVGLTGTVVLTVLIGLVTASAFPAILVYGLDLLPGRVGLIAGLFYGLIFGLGALSAAVLGHVADVTSLDFVYRLCAFLPALGVLTWFLPKLGSDRV